MWRKSRGAAVVVGLAAAGIAVAAATAAIADRKPYAVGIAGGYTTQRLISTGDTIPESSDATKQFKFVGIPDASARTAMRTGPPPSS